MAGTKETPRQRMIGMMYLVLTALLALNVSKEIVNAFVKLNDKIEDSNLVIQKRLNDCYNQFDFAMAVKTTRIAAQKWNDKASSIQKIAGSAYLFMLEETNALLKEAEGSSSNWLVTDKQFGTKKLRSLMDVEAKDDYDAATRLFVGGNPSAPNKRGMEIRNRLQQLRDNICNALGTYDEAGKHYRFDAAQVKSYDPRNPKTYGQLKQALKNANPADTSVLVQVYRTLSYPLVLEEYGETISWQGGMFDHAPVVAAAAMLTSLRGDIKSAELLAVDHLLSKISNTMIPINKIEPVAFAPKGYLNVGDTMPLRVMIAAYDSNDVSPIRFSDDPAMHGATDARGAITVKATAPGIKTIYGNIGVKERGELVWKPWSFTYEVGQPQAVISPVDLNVLYSGHENRIAVSASGYPFERLSLRGQGVSISKSGTGYIVTVAPGMVGRKVPLSVVADGRTLSTMDYRVKPMPKPDTWLGNIASATTTVKRAEFLTALQSGVRLGYDQSAIITANFKVTSFSLQCTVPGGPSPTLKSTNGEVTPAMRSLANQLRTGATVMITDIRGTGKGGQVRGNTLFFTLVP